MPKTPDEIKNGLECCQDYQSCTKYDETQCPYYDVKGCVDTLLADALALVQKLQAENAELLEKVEQLQAERDAAVKDIEQMVKDPYEPCFCDYCKLTDEECCKSNCRWRNAFVWRGVQKEE